MGNIKETKGYLTLRGKIFGLDNKEPFENDYKRSLSFGINTTKENGIFVTVGEWKNSQLSVSIKGEGMDKAAKINEQEAIEEVQGLFKNGDSVFVTLRANYNTYKERIDYLVSKIYICEKEIDFDAEDFIEKNELDVPAIITSKVEGNEINVAFATYQGQILAQKLILRDNDICDFFKNNTDIGDIVPVMLKVIKMPIYEEAEEDNSDKPVETARKTFKGRDVGGNTKSKKRKIVGNKEELEVIDIDTEKIEPSVYKTEDLGLVGDSEVDMPF